MSLPLVKAIIICIYIFLYLRLEVHLTKWLFRLGFSYDNKIGNAEEGLRRTFRGKNWERAWNKFKGMRAQVSLSLSDHDPFLLSHSNFDLFYIQNIALIYHLPNDGFCFSKDWILGYPIMKVAV